MSFDTSEVHQPCAVEMARLESDRQELRRTIKQLEGMLEAMLAAVVADRHAVRGVSSIAEAYSEANARLEGLRSRMREMPSVYGARS